MTKVPEFTTLDDARTYCANAGLIDWQWFDGFDEEELIEHMYRHANGEQSCNDLLRGFLRHHGENPANYINPNR